MSKNRNHARQWLAYAETNRREKSGGFPSLPISAAPAQGHPHGQQEVDVIDYAEPLSQMKLAVAHLDEALPTTQLERTLAAYRALKAATGDLEVWLRLNGVLAGGTEH
jgi:hypothetical protein